MMDLYELKRLHDKAYNHGQTTRERASDDLVFYWVTQWDDNLLQDSQLAYRGEFNILRKAGRQIMSDLRSNPIQVDFDPRDQSREDGAELLDGLYRSDDRRNESLEAYTYAQQDAVVCGFGAWELYTAYESNRIGDDKQVIQRRFIPEANNTVFWDPNAKRVDKADAKYCSVLVSYSEDGYKELYEELKGEEPDTSPQSFSEPEQSYAFPWFAADDRRIYVATIYTRKKVKDTVYEMVDPVGQTLWLRESDLEEVMDDMIDSGYTIESEKAIERWEVTRYVVSGQDILEEQVIAGEHIPVVPVYGERAYVEGQEHYEGITRLAKDPQRLRNFQMSYLADIVSRSPRTKPIFTPEQIQGFEDMYSEAGADNNYPYLLQNRFDANGQPLPIGPVAQMPEQPMPSALVASIQLSREAVDDVANAGMPQDIADPDLSGKAVLALQNRVDQQSFVYQDNMKYAKRRDGQVYASMASEVYSAPREVTLTMPDGSRQKSRIMNAVIDQETGEFKVLNDISNMEFDVYSDITPTYASQKQATLDQMSMMIQGMQPGDPTRNILTFKALELMDGVSMDDIRDYAKKQLLLLGLKEPESEEEIAFMQQQMQQGQQPDANMVLAQAEMMKGQAAQMREQREMMKAQADAQIDAAKIQVDQFEAETGRMGVQVDAQKAGADINTKQIEAFGKQMDNVAKAEALRAKRFEEMSDSELIRIARGF